MLAPTEATALVTVVERAAKEGIPVTIFDSGINTDQYVSFVSSNNYAAGVQAADTLAEILGRVGKIAVVKNVPGSSSTMEREAGFEETLAKKYPRMGNRRLQVLPVRPGARARSGREHAHGTPGTRWNVRLGRACHSGRGHRVAQP